MKSIAKLILLLDSLARLLLKTGQPLLFSALILRVSSTIFFSSLN